MADPTLWQLYEQTLANLAQVAPGEVFSITALNTYTDLGSPIPAICNASIYQLGNGIPVSTGTYSIHSGVFTAYWIYLSYLLEAAQPLTLAAAGTVDFGLYRQLVSTLTPSNPSQAALLNSTPLSQTHQHLMTTLGPSVPTICAALDQCWLAMQPEKVATNMWVQLAPNAAQYLYPGYALENWSDTFAQWQTCLAPVAVLDAISVNVPQSAPSFIQVDTASLAAQGGTTTLSLSVSMDAFGTFNLIPAAWFDTRFFDASRYPLPAGAPPFLALDGPLGLLPARAVLGFRPNLKLRASTLQTAQQVASNVSRIGPFSVQAGAVTGAGSDQFDIELDSTDIDIPVLLGVISIPSALGRVVVSG